MINTQNPAGSTNAEIITELDDQNCSTGIEYEEPQEKTSLRPYDPELIRVDPKAFSLRQILDMIDDGDLELAPDFQRLKVWRAIQKSRLIESVLLRIPLPAFYFSSDPDGKLQVVDGLQRLSTIYDFVRGGRDKNSYFRLEGLEYLQDQVGHKTFNEIEKTPVWTRRIYQTQIMAHVIDPQTPQKVKFDIFKRINTGGSPLTGQEIRHCLSRKQSRDFLKKLTTLPIFKEATNNAISGNVRMVDREVALRFCAFRQYPGLNQYSKFDTMDEFLNKGTELLDSASAAELDSLSNEFQRSMENAKLLFNQHAFRKWPITNSRVCPFNRALFDVWSVLLVNYDSSILKAHKTNIVTLAREMMANDWHFIASVSAGTSDTYKVATRFEKVGRLLESQTK